MRDNEHEQEKLCGFDKEPCIKDKCVFWTEVLMGTQLGQKRVPMCVFPALLLVTGSPKPQLRGVPLEKMGIKL